MTLEELRRIAVSVSERRGWDFSRVRDDRDPVPWDYADVVQRYLQPSSRVLDIGTGGGERFIALAPYFDTGIGIDANPTMIQTAQENTPPSLTDKLSFKLMRAQALQFPDCSFDIVLNRHCSVSTNPIVRVLRPGGVFITQQVGARNFQNICSLFGCGPGGGYDEWDPPQEALAEAFQQNGCTVIARAEYDVRYFFLDIESLVFNLKAVSIPEDFDIEKHWRQVDQIITNHRTPRGIETNEHRELLIVQKR